MPAHLGPIPSWGPGSTGGSGACLSDVGCADQNEERGEETADETEPETREPPHTVSEKVGKSQKGQSTGRKPVSEPSASEAGGY